MENKVIISGMLCDNGNETYFLEKPVFYYGTVQDAISYARKQLEADYGEDTGYNLFSIDERTEADGVKIVDAFFDGGFAEYRIDEIE